MPFARVVADAGYGDNPTLLHGLDARHVAYVVGVSSTCGVRLPDEVRTAALVLPSRPRQRGQPQKPRPALLDEARTVRAALPAVQRQVLLWLCQEVVLWLIATNQIAPFRPRRL